MCLCRNNFGRHGPGSGYSNGISCRAGIKNNSAKLIFYHCNQESIIFVMKRLKVL